MHMQEVARSHTKQADENSADEQGADQRNDHVDKILKAQAAEVTGNDGENSQHQETIGVGLNGRILRQEAQQAEDDTDDQIHNVGIRHISQIRNTEQT